MGEQPRLTKRFTTRAERDQKKTWLNASTVSKRPWKRLGGTKMQGWRGEGSGMNPLPPHRHPRRPSRLLARIHRSPTVIRTQPKADLMTHQPGLLPVQPWGSCTLPATIWAMSAPIMAFPSFLPTAKSGSALGLGRTHRSKPYLVWALYGRHNTQFQSS